MSSAIAGPARSRSVPGPGRAGVRGIGPQPWLAHLERHLPLARAGEDPEGVHQVRVACARLLVWLEMGGWRVLRDDLRWLRGHAARMRDLDVLRTEDGLALLPEPTELLTARRELVRALDDPRVESVILALSSMPPVPARQARAAASRFARTALRRGRGLGGRNGSVAALHRLRCAVRRLRFALEWTGVEAARVVELQDALGIVCDHAGAAAAREGIRCRRRGAASEARADAEAKPPGRAARLEEGAAPADEVGLMDLFVVLAGRGRRRARRAARALVRLGASGARVLHSPRLRALETADVLLRRLGGEGVACRGLDEAPSAELLAQMAGERVVVVGHEPWLGRLVAGLVLGAPRGARFRLDEAGVAWLEGEARPDGMRMKALLPRRCLGSLGRKKKRKGKP